MVTIGRVQTSYDSRNGGANKIDGVIRQCKPFHEDAIYARGIECCDTLRRVVTTIGMNSMKAAGSVTSLSGSRQ